MPQKNVHYSREITVYEYFPGNILNTRILTSKNTFLDPMLNLWEIDRELTSIFAEVFHHFCLPFQFVWIVKEVLKMLVRVL